MSDLRSQPRVERGSEGSARRVELRAHLVAAGHRFIANGPDQITHPALMCRITDGQQPGDRESFRLWAEFINGSDDRRFIEGLGLLPGRIVTAAHADDHPPSLALQA